MTPAGVYRYRLVPGGGTCSSDLVDALAAATYPFTLDTGIPCDTYTHEETIVIDGACVQDNNFFLSTSERGIDDGELGIELRGCGASNCVHTFEMRFL